MTTPNNKAQEQFDQITDLVHGTQHKTTPSAVSNKPDFTLEYLDTLIFSIGHAPSSTEARVCEDTLRRKVQELLLDNERQSSKLRLFLEASKHVLKDIESIQRGAASSVAESIVDLQLKYEGTPLELAVQEALREFNEGCAETYGEHGETHEFAPTCIKELRSIVSLESGE